MRRKDKSKNKYPNMMDSAKPFSDSHEMMLVYAGPVRRSFKAKKPDDLTVMSAVYAGPTPMELFPGVDEQASKGTEETEGPTTFCKECGKKISVNAKFCPDCGTPCPGIEKA